MTPSPLAWGSVVSADFRSKVMVIANDIDLWPSDLMSCMAFEDDETFAPDKRNTAGSGAVGLIQFMPQTAAALGTTTQALAGLTAEGQLDYVHRYFAPWKGRLHNLGDLYMAILWPAGVGKPDGYVLFAKSDPVHPRRYIQNKGLDFNADGLITRGEACAKIEAKKAKGLQPPYVWAAT